ncbi:excalibur calcium-binding domain-containing protein [Streptomyces sp. NBC_00829]|uniref:excalibur calcium-binding domain-containing protein n=1 Tax=Streptomyces sp. NBC_00829 TaxID=2903679 RepID=UPI0038682219|nr:excalibur calcium-binding domain-containing protein [Streptomyces sp. NBC_00829]
MTRIRTTRIRTHGRIAVAAAGAVMAVVGLTACGAETAGDAKSAAAGNTAGASATPTPTAQGVLELADDQQSAETGKEIVVKVLSNDTVTLGDGTGGNVQMVLDDTDFSVSVGAPPAHGTATVDGNTVVYRPAAGYAGEDEFRYRVNVTAGRPLSETAVVRITVAVPSSTPKASAQTEVAYANCDAVQAAGAVPIHAGDPGYGPHLDLDGDGVGCE